MDETGRNLTSFRFRDPRQQRIYEELRELVGHGPAAFFRDACWLMENDRVLHSTSHLVAHLLREIESALRSVLKPISLDGAEADSEELSQRELIERILQSLGVEKHSREGRAWFELSERLHGIAHRRGLESPRSPEEVQELWENAQTLLDVLLKGVRGQFLKWFPLLDELLSKPQPTKKHIKRLTNEIPNNTVIRRYFFDRLENPEWLEPLWSRGFFRNPPEPERNEEEGTIQFLPWPEARYLARMAKHKPELVARIIQEMPDTDNALVQEDLTDALLEMPPEVAGNLVEKAQKWARSPYLRSPEKLGHFIAHLANGGKTEEAMEIAQVLLDVMPDPRQEQIPELDEFILFSPEPRARFDSWQYEQILRNDYPELVQMAGLPALELLCDLLEKAIRLSRTRADKKETEDYSSIWRPAIEEHSQNLGHTIKDVLVSGVRDASELAVKSGKATVEEVVDALERRRWKVFRRIALHVLRLFAEQAITLVAARLIDRSLFNDAGLRYEYVLLLRKCFSQLPEVQQQIILGWIKAGPDIEMFTARQKEKTGTFPSEDEIISYREKWQRNRLAWIGLENLPRDWQARYWRLVEQHGEPEHPEFVSYTTTWVGPTSPKTAEELKEMSVAEIVEFLKTWSPPENVFREPSPEGLGRILSSVIAEDPKRFASEAIRFQDLDPTYVRAFFSGLREGLKYQHTFTWEPVLALCQWVLTQPREIQSRQAEIGHADPDWGWTRKRIADLLSTGFEDGAGSIPFKFRKKVWDILKPLTEDPEPTQEYEQRYGGSNMDPATLSINTTRGEALHAVIRYALWVRRHIEKQADAQERLSKGFDEMPEVRQVLDAHLSMTQEPSLAIRAVYGQWFPWLVLLDPRWAKTKASRIFPVSDKHSMYFEAAWYTYIAFSEPYDNVFEVLRKQYQHAVQQIGSRRENIKRLGDPDKRLAEHLMVFYWRGRLGLNNPLLVAFWEKGSDELRGHAIAFVGRALQQTLDPIAAEIIERLKQLWEARLARAKKSSTNHEKELAAFGWWFVSEKFDESWAVAQLAESLRLVGKTEPERGVLEHLAKIAEAHPVEAVECLRMIVEGDREGWIIYTRSDHIKSILKLALQNPNIRDKAEQIIHYLGSRGFWDFRNLLNGG